MPPYNAVHNKNENKYTTNCFALVTGKAMQTIADANRVLQANNASAGACNSKNKMPATLAIKLAIARCLLLALCTSTCFTCSKITKFIIKLLTKTSSKNTSIFHRHNYTMAATFAKKILCQNLHNYKIYCKQKKIRLRLIFCFFVL